MILHCTPPYTCDIPNPALGYLKGFLQAKGISVRNIYWNLVLLGEIENFKRNLEINSGNKLDFSSESITLYIWRHLLTDVEGETPFDVLVQSIVSRSKLRGVIHSIREKIDWYIKENDLHKDGLAGFTVKTYQWMMGSYISGQLKKLNPEIAVVIGGITNEQQGRTFMNVFPQIDYAIWGEGEYPLFCLAEALTETDISVVPNLLYRDGTRICSTKKIGESSELDLHPFADHTDYFDTLNQVVSSPVRVRVPIWGSRSCPWNKCKFCVLNEEYSYRTRSPENIVEEIEFQSKTHGVNRFIFVDTELPGNRKRFKTLLALLIKASAGRKEPYQFFAEVSPVFINEETAHHMQVASFTSIQMGFEAMTDSLLEKMEKRHRFAHNIRALKLGSQYGITIDGLNIIRGIPSETKEDVTESCKNLKFVRFFLNTYTLLPSQLILYKGSPFFEEMPEEKRRNLTYQRLWEEAAPLNIIPAGERFEFFGFPSEKPAHFPLWNIFEMMLDSYQQQNRSYTWIEYEDGSFIEEKGPEIYKYKLDGNETALLVFCDSMKTLSEVREQFPYSSDELCELLRTLKEWGLLYYDRNSDTIISVVDASRRIRTPRA